MQPNERRDHVYVTISERLASLPPSPFRPSIFRVQSQLRNVNEKAYEPNVIAVGPYHRGKDHLQMMEEHKLHYLRSLLQRRNKDVNELVDMINGSLEQKARRCYAEPISLGTNEFVDIMLLDGCFIIELFLRFNEPRDMNNPDPIYEMDWIVNSLQRDLLLLENQLPFFILLHLFDMIEGSNRHDKFISLAWAFFGDIIPVPKAELANVDGIIASHKIKHLLSFIYIKWRPSFAKTGANGVHGNTIDNLRFIRCASELLRAGVKFEMVKGSTLFAIKLKNGLMKIPRLVIEIPCLVIEDRTEALFRNLIAYEQYYLDTHYIIDYVKFLDCLINSRQDVGILCRRGIIENWLGDDEVVSTMFNKMTDSITWPYSSFLYAEICHQVDIHCSKRIYRWMEILKRNYLNSPWAYISVIAAIVLLVLTLLQTIYTIKSYTK